MADQPLHHHHRHRQPEPQQGGRFMDIYTLLPLIFIPPTALKWFMVSSITGDWIFLLAAVFFVGMWLYFKLDHDDLHLRARQWYDWYQMHRQHWNDEEDEEELDDILENDDEDDD
ncbi:hypothetical protein CAEBREN_10430 [Caenorhabditis brenneri]|uniref:Uncharacterized protein n=1 Tax=Caenorhabditis brenneri TaxID=135651 RepID=G0NDG7_CAEBE|nr:hypothetical protein CAEBREN_10430 [Caenorhabditis brenneri]